MMKLQDNSANCMSDLAFRNMFKPELDSKDYPLMVDMSENRPSEDRHALNPKVSKVYKSETYTEYEFPHILSAVRQVNGGSNYGWNEAVERRYSKRVRKLEKSSSGTFHTAYSSEYESFKTAQSTSPETLEDEARASVDHQNQLLTEKFLLGNNEDHQDMPSLITKQTEFIGISEIPPSSSVFLNGEQSVSPIKCGALYQSQEDEDLYCHPLRELIQKDPEWQKLRLRRKGTEVTFTPRSYFMNLDPNDIAFQSNPSSTAVTLRTRKKKSKISKRRSFR